MTTSATLVMVGLAVSLMACAPNLPQATQTPTAPHRARGLVITGASYRAKDRLALEDLIAEPLPDVSGGPIYSWAGPSAVPQNTRHLLRN